MVSIVINRNDYPEQNISIIMTGNCLSQAIEIWTRSTLDLYGQEHTSSVERFSEKFDYKAITFINEMH